MGGPVKVQVGGAWVDGATFVSDGSAFSAGTVYVQIGGAWVPEAGATPPPSTAYADAVLADSPIGYWRLGESSGTTAADASGGGHPGTYNGGNVTLGVTGAVGGNTAITSNGSVTGPPVTIATYASTPTTLTIEGWVRLNVTPPARHQCLMSISLDATTRIMAEARRNATGNRVALWDNVNSWRESTAAALTTGVWHHLAYGHHRCRPHHPDQPDHRVRAGRGRSAPRRHRRGRPLQHGAERRADRRPLRRRMTCRPDDRSA
jgi:hypothetical protein